MITGTIIWPSGEVVFLIALEIAQNKLDAETCEEFLDAVLEAISNQIEQTERGFIK